MNYTYNVILTVVDCGAPTQRISKRNSTSNASWGTEPQLDFQFLQAMQVYVSSHQVQS